MYDKSLKGGAAGGGGDVEEEVETWRRSVWLEAAEVFEVLDLVTEDKSRFNEPLIH